MASALKQRRLFYQNEADLQRQVTPSYIDEVFLDLNIFLKSIIESDCTEKYSTPFDSMVNSVQEATNLEQIVEACDDLKICYSSEGNFSGIQCLPCTTAGEKSGVFYVTNKDMNCLGAKNQPIQSARFRSVKSHIKKHLLSYPHGIHAKVSTNNDRTQIVTKAYVNTKVENIKQLVERLCRKPEFEDSKAKQNSENPKCTSIEDLLNQNPLFRLHFISERDKTEGKFDGLICTVCYKGTSKQKGFFTYTSEQGTSFAGKKRKQENQSEPFRHLKKHIKDHMVCKTHLSAVGGVFQPKPADLKRIEMDLKAGMNLGTLAYKSIVKDQSKAGFEQDVALAADFGLDVGQLNHSRRFVDHLFPELYAVLKDQTIATLNNSVAPNLEPSPFVVWADKMTPCGTTLQIIGIIIFKDGKNVPVVLDIMPVTQRIQNGAALAQDIVTTLLKFYTQKAAKKLYVGCAMDGQYFKLGVPKHILMLLGHELDPSISNEVVTQTLFESASWDPAHLLELACLDVAKSKMYTWVEILEQRIASINKGNSIGKQFHRLMEKARELEKKLLKPGSFSDTRFCTYKHKVFKNFINNFPMLFDKLSEDGDSCLNLINNSKFCLRLCGLTDIFDLIGSTSVHVQSAELLPWQCDAYIESCLAELDGMSAELKAETYRGNSTTLKCLTQCYNEITSKGSFMGKGVYLEELGRISTRQTCSQYVGGSFNSVAERVLTELSNYVDAVAASIKSRYTRNHTQKAFLTSCNAFSLDKIMEHGPEYIPDGFGDYCLLAKESGFIDKELPQLELNQQYNKFVSLVHSALNEYHSKGRQVPEERLYWEIITSTGANSCKTVLDLLISALCRNKSECIAESVGSIIKEHLDKRANKTEVNLGQEVFLHVNGPNPNRECAGLVRKALDRLFDGGEYQFIRRSHPSDLKSYEVSKVVDRIHEKSGKILVPDI